MTDLITDEMVEAGAAAVIPFDSLEKRHWPWNTAPIAEAVLTAALPLSPLCKENERKDAEIEELREHGIRLVGRLAGLLRGGIVHEATIERQAAEIERLRGREKSIYAWAKAARTKGSGLSPSRALRWIDELGDRAATSGVWVVHESQSWDRPTPPESQEEK